MPNPKPGFEAVRSLLQHGQTVTFAFHKPPLSFFSSDGVSAVSKFRVEAGGTCRKLEVLPEPALSMVDADVPALLVATNRLARSQVPCHNLCQQNRAFVS